jgi:hypothetical protein
VLVVGIARQPYPTTPHTTAGHSTHKPIGENEEDGYDSKHDDSKHNEQGSESYDDGGAVLHGVDDLCDEGGGVVGERILDNANNAQPVLRNVTDRHVWCWRNVAVHVCVQCDVLQTVISN